MVFSTDSLHNMAASIPSRKPHFLFSVALAVCFFILGTIVGSPSRVFNHYQSFLPTNSSSFTIFDDIPSRPTNAIENDTQLSSSNVTQNVSETFENTTTTHEENLDVSSAVTASTASSQSGSQDANLTTSQVQLSGISNSSCNMPRPPEYPLQPPGDPTLPQVILDYIDFHKTARACLLDSECKDKPPILVANCPRKQLCLGLGDRMRGIQFTFVLAVVTRRVLFLHKLGNDYPLEAGFAPFAIDWTLPPTVQYNHSWPYLEWYWCKRGKACNYESPSVKALSGFDGEGPDLNLYTDDIVKTFSDKPVISLANRLTYGNVIYLERNPYLNHSFAELSRNITRKKINFHRLLFQPSEATRQVLKTVDFTGDHLSVHIRNGVDAKETKEPRFKYFVAHQEETVDKILECLERLRKEKNTSNLFLASDSSETKELFLAKGKEKGFDVHLLQAPTMHIEKYWLKSTLTMDAKCQGYISVFVDLFMLARGKKMIRTGSNLSYFAGFLGGDSGFEIKSDNRTLDKWCPS